MKENENFININDNLQFKNDFENNKNKIVGGYDEDLVINKNYLESLDNIYKCNICYKIMINPVECEECGHNFCYNCINLSDCPFGCKNKIIKPSSLAIKNLLSQLRFKCPNIGCTISFDYTKIEKHNNECQFQKIKCPNKYCDKEIMRKDMNNHILNECEFLLIKCKYCNFEFMKKEIENHENICKLINKGRDSINYDNNKIDFDEHLKRLSKNIKQIIKNNQKLAENSEKNNNDKNDDYPGRISIRSSFVPGLEGDEFLDIIQKEIESKIKNYYNEFNINFTKIITEIGVIKELFKNNVNDFMIENNLNESYNIKQKEYNKNKENEEEIKKYFNNLIDKTENNVKNLIDEYNKKFSNEFSSINNIFEENKDVISDDINKDNDLKTNKDMYFIINNIINNLREYLSETNNQIKNLYNNFHNNLNILINDKNINKNIDSNELEKDINNFIEKDIKNIFKKLDERINKKELMKNENNKESEIIKDNIIIDKSNENNNNEKKDKINELNNKIISNEVNFLNNQFGDVNNELINIKNNIKQVINVINEKFIDFSDLINSKNINDTKNIEKEKQNIFPLEISSTSSFSLLKTEKQENNKIILNIKDNDNDDSFHSAEFITNSDNLSNPFILLKNLENKMTSLESNSKDFLLKLKERVKSELTEKLNEINLKCEKDIDKRIEKMFSLKYCKECEKIDYFYGFINCCICKEDICKQCVAICLICKNFCCIKCCLCQKCERMICDNCRILCSSCNIKYCQLCIMNCPSCNNQICSACVVECSSCSKKNCILNCSKTCNLCMKNFCKSCSKNIKVLECNLCKNFVCEKCYCKCKEHDNIICKNCSNKCGNCNNIFCNKYLIECNNCNIKYCLKCGKYFEENNKCQFCHNVFCNNCANKNKNLKCISCQKKLCNKCSFLCNNCSNNHCKKCSSLCKGCNNSTCIKCSSECICEKEKFCNKCMQKNEIIYSHNCVYFLNNCSITESKKTRSLKKIPNKLNIEAKFSIFMNDVSDKSFLFLGITDNNNFEDNSKDEIKNIFAVNVNNGDKYCSEKGFEDFLDFENINKGFNEVYVMIKEYKLFFKINKSIYKWAYELKKKTNYWFYFENNINGSTAKFLYAKKIK